MWDSPLFIEYLTRERISALALDAERMSLQRSLRAPRTRRLRQRLARGLISLGLHLDPQAGGPASHGSRPRLASR